MPRPFEMDEEPEEYVDSQNQRNAAGQGRVNDPKDGPSRQATVKEMRGGNAASSS